MPDRTDGVGPAGTVPGMDSCTDVPHTQDTVEQEPLVWLTTAAVVANVIAADAGAAEAKLRQALEAAGFTVLDRRDHCSEISLGAQPSEATADEATL